MSSIRLACESSTSDGWIGESLGSSRSRSVALSRAVVLQMSLVITGTGEIALENSPRLLIGLIPRLLHLGFSVEAEVILDTFFRALVTQPR